MPSTSTMMTDELRRTVHSKLVAYGYSSESDTIMAEFILTMIQNRKNRGQIDQELVELVGTDYNPDFGAWLESIMPANPGNSVSTPSTALQSKVPEHKLGGEEETAPANNEKSVPPATIHNHEDKSRQPHPQQRELYEEREWSHRMSSHGQYHKHYTLRDRSPERMRRERWRSRSRSPLYHSRHNRSGRKSYGYNSYYDTYRASYKSSIFERLGSGRGRRAGDGYMRNTGRRQRYMDTEMSYSSHEFRGPQLPPRKTPLPIRCSYWPHCLREEECKYFHPREPCKKYPNCPKAANECLFIHPAGDKAPTNAATAEARTKIPCKYGVHCPIIKDCKYLHPTLEEIQCKYDPQCLNPRCPYRHTAPRPDATSNGDGGAASTPVVCRFGSACLRPDCFYLHPPKPTRTSMVPCKFSLYCTRPDCKFFHPHRNKSVIFNSADGVASSGANSQQQNPDSATNATGSTHVSERQFAATDGVEQHQQQPESGPVDPVPGATTVNRDDDDEDLVMQI